MKLLRKILSRINELIIKRQPPRCLFSFSKTMNTESLVCAYCIRGDSMDKDKLEKLNQKKSEEKFNNITQKVKPENQNQTHNVRSEAVEPKIRQV